MNRIPLEEQFICFNIRDYLNPEESGGIGESDLEKILSDFSITMKPVTVKVAGMSNSVKRKLSRLSHFDQKTDSYTISSYLIAQLGRNYSEEVKYPITGNMLMNFAIDTLHEIQRQLGGLMVYLECEEKEPLLKFYQEQNGFRLFGQRVTEEYRAGESHKLLQLLNFL